MRQIVSFLLVAAVLAWGQGAPWAGRWYGEIGAGGQTLHFIFDLKAGGGTWQSVDQGASLPVEAVTLAGQTLTIQSSLATVKGPFDAARQEIVGQFQQGPVTLPITLRRTPPTATAKAARPPRPQEPVRPLPYREEEVQYQGGGGVKLAGTLTYPPGAGPYAAALLLTGSGAQDRDETLLGHKPFLVLADALTRAGLAVLRVDDRGTGQSGGVFAETTYGDKCKRRSNNIAHCGLMQGIPAMRKPSPRIRSGDSRQGRLQGAV